MSWKTGVENTIELGAAEGTIRHGVWMLEGVSLNARGRGDRILLGWRLNASLLRGGGGAEGGANEPGDNIAS